MSLTFVSRPSNGRPKVCKAKAVKVEPSSRRNGGGVRLSGERGNSEMPNDYKLPGAILITATTAEQ